MDGGQRRRLATDLCARYPSHGALERFLDWELSRPLVLISGPADLLTVAARVVREAEAGGWLGQLVDAAAADSPDRPDLFAADVRPPQPERAAPRHVVLLGTPLLAPLADAVRNDERVASARFFPTATAARDALPTATAVAVSTDLGWDPQQSPSAERELLRLLVARPVVLVEFGHGTRSGDTVASRIAAAVVQILVAGDPATVARRLVDNLDTGPR